MGRYDRIMQYTAAAVVNISAFAAGVSMVWTSPVVPHLNTRGYSPLNRDITSTEAMWLGSLVSLGTAFAPFGTAYLTKKWGRKVTLLLGAVPAVVGWILVGTTVTITQLFVGRFLQGVACGFMFSVVPMYVAEISEDDNRGSLGSFMQIFLTTGMLFAYATGPFIGYVSFAIACGMVPIIFFAAFWFMPESPYYYLAKGQYNDALYVLATFRGQPIPQVEQEAKAMQIAVEEDLRTRGSYLDLVSIPRNRKALFLCCGLAAFFQLSGVNVVIMYAETILLKAAVKLAPEIVTITMGVVQAASCFVTPFLSDRMGRRTLLMVSAAGMTISMGMLGLFFFLDERDYEIVQSLNWMPALSEILFIATNSVGFGALPFVVMGEMFPTNVKSQAAAVITFTCFFIGFLVGNYFDALDKYIGTSYTFWIYSVLCIAAGLFVYFFLPETKGLSFQEIQNKLVMNNRNKVKPLI